MTFTPHLAVPQSRVKSMPPLRSNRRAAERRKKKKNEAMQQSGPLRMVEWWPGSGLASVGASRAGYTVVGGFEHRPEKAGQALGYKLANPKAGPLVVTPFADLGRMVEPVDVAWVNMPGSMVSTAGPKREIPESMAETVKSVVGQVVRVTGEPTMVVVHAPMGIARMHRTKSMLAYWAKALNDAGYLVDAIQVDTRWWLPQSRPRLLLVGVNRKVVAPVRFPNDEFRPSLLRPSCVGPLFASQWFDTTLLRFTSVPEPVSGGLHLFVDPDVAFDVEFGQQVQAHLNRTSEPILAQAMARDGRSLFTSYRYTRRGWYVVWELRADGIAGCLRQYTGGSSRQVLVCVEDGVVGARRMTTREYAALMGYTGTLPAASVKDVIGGLTVGTSVPVAQWFFEQTHSLVEQGRAMQREQDLAEGRGLPPQ